MTEDDSWRRSEEPPRGPSTPPDLQFNPLACAIGVFFAIAIPGVVFGYTRPAGPDGAIILIGVVLGLLAGFLAGLWVAHRRGQIWRGPHM